MDQSVGWLVSEPSQSVVVADMVTDMEVDIVADKMADMGADKKKGKKEKKKVAKLCEFSIHIYHTRLNVE